MCTQCHAPPVLSQPRGPRKACQKVVLPCHRNQAAGSKEPEAGCKGTTEVCVGEGRAVDLRKGRGGGRGGCSTHLLSRLNHAAHERRARRWCSHATKTKLQEAGSQMQGASSRGVGRVGGSGSSRTPGPLPAMNSKEQCLPADPVQCAHAPPPPRPRPPATAPREPAPTCFWLVMVGPSVQPSSSRVPLAGVTVAATKAGAGLPGVVVTRHSSTSTPPACRVSATAMDASCVRFLLAWYAAMLFPFLLLSFNLDQVFPSAPTRVIRPFTQAIPSGCWCRDFGGP